MNISKHPVLAKCYKFALELEKLPASEQQTNLAVMFSDLCTDIGPLIDTLKLISELQQSYAYEAPALAKEHFTPL